MTTDAKALPVVGEDGDVMAVMAAIDAGGCHIAVVVDSDRHVLGVVSDGDVRRAILRGVPASAPVAGIMNRAPLMGRQDEAPEAIFRLMRERVVTAVPVVDGEGRLVRIATIHQAMVEARPLPTAVIMAGGEGRRLRPFTETVPKPMMEVGNKPLIEHAVDRLVRSGFQKVHVAVNYLGDQIRSHLGDGSEWGADISYLEEPAKLGTAGALSLLPKGQDGPLLVLNGDIFTGIDYSRMVAAHAEGGSALTIGVVEYHIHIPYGVIAIDGDRVVGLVEKPEQRMPISAGVYVIEPRLLERIPPATFYNMTDLIADALAAGEKISPFLILEEWIDIGTPKDLERARTLAESLS